jgi:inner membrane protein involved in colicin E2 resistance
MPEKLQPGPLASQIATFAPVSLFFFIVVLLTIGIVKKVEIHPMHFFFLAASFFAFHLLFAYLADQLSIHVAFVIAAATSLTLTTSYLRVVFGARFAFLAAGSAQLVYLVLFSYAFFFKGLTGLAITIGAIATLFVLMQATARIDWNDVFARRAAPGSPDPSALSVC